MLPFHQDLHGLELVVDLNTDISIQYTLQQVLWYCRRYRVPELLQQQIKTKTHFQDRSCQELNHYIKVTQDDCEK